jgi:type I restriction enzyme S subunit
MTSAMTAANSSVELGSVADIVAGQHIPAAKYNRDGKGTPYLTGPADFGERFPAITKWTSEPKAFARHGDVLVTVKGNGCGKVNLGIDAAIGRQLMAIRPRPTRLHGSYLYHYLLHVEESLAGLGRGATVPGIGISALAGVRVPLPDLVEQRHVATILDKADEIIRKRVQLGVTASDLVRAAFVQLFGSTWSDGGASVVRFGDLLTSGLRNGLSPSTRGRTPAKVLTLSAITGVSFNPNAIKEGMFDDSPVPGKCVSSDDLLVCRGNGNLALVGAAKVPSVSMPDTLFPDTIIAASVDFSRIDRRFLEFVWQSPYVRRQIEKGSRTTNGTHKINQTLVENLRVPCPPMKAQRRFGMIRDVESRLIAQAADPCWRDLLAALRERAFRGRF